MSEDVKAHRHTTPRGRTFWRVRIDRPRSWPMRYWLQLDLGGKPIMMFSNETDNGWIVTGVQGSEYWGMHPLREWLAFGALDLAGFVIDCHEVRWRLMHAR